MIANVFNHVRENFSEFKGKMVSYKYFIPSANRYAESKGRIESIGLKYNSECLVISDRAKKHAIHYSYVTI